MPRHRISEWRHNVNKNLKSFRRCPKKGKRGKATEKMCFDRNGDSDGKLYKPGNRCPRKRHGIPIAATCSNGTVVRRIFK